MPRLTGVFFELVEQGRRWVASPFSKDHIATIPWIPPSIASASSSASFCGPIPPAWGGPADPGCWTAAEGLLRAAADHVVRLDRTTLARVVRENDKQRFALSPDGALIRANQGHSVTVDLGLPVTEPPAQAYHGTADRLLPSIRRDRLCPGARAHVHLSSDEVTARRVGQRHGRPVVLSVAAAAMHAAGHRFWRSENGVWLVERAPVEFLQFPAK